MDEISLTGAQRAFLRGLGQRLEAALMVGREGLTAAVAAELDRLLRAHELVKVRFVNADRSERGALCEAIARQLGGPCVGAVGHTALFYRPNPDPADRRLELPH